MTRRWRPVLLCIALTVSTTACGGSRQLGEPTPAASTSNSEKPSRPLGPRPKDISVQDVDPCQLLTDRQLEQLRYDKDRRPAPGTRPGEARCGVSNLFGSPPNYGSLLVVVPTEDISVWLTPSRQDGIATTNRISVSGFPALEMTGKLTKDDCQIVVDVSDGQHLDIFSRPSGGERGTSPEPLCVEARRVAEMAMQTLLAKQ